MLRTSLIAPRNRSWHAQLRRQPSMMLTASSACHMCSTKHVLIRSPSCRRYMACGTEGTGRNHHGVVPQQLVDRRTLSPSCPTQAL